MNDKQRAIAACAKIRHAFPSSREPVTQLAWAVTRQAIMDAFAESDKITQAERYSAYRYLHGNMPWSSILGVEPDYIRGVLLRAGLPLPTMGWLGD